MSTLVSDRPALIDERSSELRERLPQWRYDADRRALYRQVRFRDFSQAFCFMTRVAMMAEQADHHPEWSNVYNRVDIWLTTHDAGGVSQRDLDLALRIDQIAG
jgi:4a-hydroxytetrahydrobiopterin dehydratase